MGRGTHGMNPTMLPRDVLLDWLQRGASRLRVQRRLDDLVRGACLLAAVGLLNALVAHFPSSPAPASALRVLSLLVAGAILTALAWRLRWRPSLGQVAAAADARAGLADTLLSAHWFATRTQPDAFVELQLLRAARVTEGLSIARLFPFRLPRTGTAATLVLLIAATGIVFLPRGSEAEMASEAGAELRAGAASGKPQSDGSARARGSETRAAAAGDGQRTPPEGSSSDVGRDLAAAPAAQSEPATATGTGRASPGVARAGEGRAGTGAGSEAPGDQINQTLAKSILDRLAELVSADAGKADEPRPGQTEAASPTGGLEHALRKEQEASEASASRQNKPGEDALNTSLRALSRSGISGRDMVHGEGNSAEEAGSANVGEGAMGRRIGTSTAGAGEGDQPVGALVAPQPGDEVLGRRTERLEVQLRRTARLQPDEAREDGDGPVSPEESFYAATRAQAARTGFKSVEGGAQSSAEAPADDRRFPIEFRDAMKRYTLARHRREPAPVQAEAPAR
jgi:hypothetical protein